MFEEKLGHRLPPGYNPKVVSLRLTIDPVRMSHRSLLWYWCVHVVDLLTSVRLWIHSFVLFPTAGWLRVFPGRPHARLFSNGGSSPAADLSYWYRPHTSKTDLPVVFLHGLGVGVYPYTPFLGEIAKEVGPGVGVFVVEMMPISTRVCHEAPTPEQFYEQMAQILDFHQVGSFVLVGHSYGTILATHLLHSRLAPRIDSLVLLDPICFLLHLPSVAYNFTTRPAKSANELQLEYFASLDPGIAHSICRHFFWTQNVLWKEELGERKCVVSVGGRDLIIDVEQVWEYLTDGQGGVVGQGMKKVWTGGKWSVHWFGDADHAQVFDTKERRKGLVDAVAELTRAVKSGYGTL